MNLVEQFGHPHAAGAAAAASCELRLPVSCVRPLFVVLQPSKKLSGLVSVKPKLSQMYSLGRHGFLSLNRRRLFIRTWYVYFREKILARKAAAAKQDDRRQARSMRVGCCRR